MFHNSFRDLCGKLRSAVNLSVACSKNGRDSPGKRLGVKNGNGSTVKPNDIIVRQRGTKYWPGENVIMGRDHTLHSSCDGIVEFTKSDANSKKLRTYVNVRKIIPLGHGEGSFNFQNIREMVV